MKLVDIFETVMDRAGLKKEGKKSEMAAKAANLKSSLDKVRDAEGLEAKKSAAKAMAKYFKVGGADQFVAKVDKATTPGQVDGLAYNAALKGEGKGAKLY